MSFGTRGEIRADYANRDRKPRGQAVRRGHSTKLGLRDLAECDSMVAFVRLSRSRSAYATMAPAGWWDRHRNWHTLG